MSTIRFEQVTRQFVSTDAPAVDRLDLDVADGEFMVLVGPSGSGKSTALRMLAGLEDVDDGGIWIGDRDVTYVRPRDRDIAMVFQNYALYPYLDVAANIAFPLRMARVPKPERARRVQQAAELLGLHDLLHRKPGQLSGGQRQRVAMGRAIVREPSAFLMDEPLSNLDAKLRGQMRADIAALQRRLGVTTVYVTHDQVEAMTMGDRVAVLRDGRLQQCDTPRALYDRPANTFVAGFLGSPPMNLATVGYDAARNVAAFGGAALSLSTEAAAAAGAEGLAELVVGFRPESVALASEGIPAEVEFVEELGADAHVACVVALAGGGTTRLVVRTDGRLPPAAGERVALAVRADAVHGFHPATQERLA
jgi:multiple sugar transport system ATP-binding protein